MKFQVVRAGGHPGLQRGDAGANTAGMVSQLLAGDQQHGDEEHLQPGHDSQNHASNQPLSESKRTFLTLPVQIHAVLQAYSHHLANPSAPTSLKVSAGSGRGPLVVTAPNGSG